MRSVLQASAEFAPVTEEGTHSHFLIEIFDKDGTNRRDWQSKALGGGLAPVATMTGTASATGTTSLTNASAVFPTSSQGLAGQIVVCGPNASGTGAISWGTILSNTGTVLTIDRWTSGAGGLGTTPNGTGLYLVVPGQSPANWIAISADAGAPTSADTALTSELATNGFARQQGVWSHTAAAGTFSIVTTFTCSGGAGTTINKYGLLNASSGGALPFTSSIGSPPTLLSSDTLACTSTITI